MCVRARRFDRKMQELERTSVNKEWGFEYLFCAAHTAVLAALSAIGVVLGLSKIEVICHFLTKEALKEEEKGVEIRRFATDRKGIRLRLEACPRLMRLVSDTRILERTTKTGPNATKHRLL